MEEQIEKLTFLSPKKEWITKEFNSLLEEWLCWEEEVSNIVDKPYDHNTQLEVFADGEDMMQKHNALQARTLTFLNNNLSGHGFIKGMDERNCDRTDLRLSHRVKHRLQELRVIEESIEYAEGYWSKKIKVLAAPVVIISIVLVVIKSCLGEN